jgi:hypothetical protein
MRAACVLGRPATTTVRHKQTRSIISRGTITFHSQQMNP